MILLDTNVVSEPFRTKPDPRVIDWLDSQLLETLFLSVITVAELRLGIARLARGRRRIALHTRLETQVLPAFTGRVLAFDLPATSAYAELMAKTTTEGKPLPLADGMIAAIASSNGLMVATRDTAPFLAAGLSVVDPWIAI